MKKFVAGVVLGFVASWAMAFAAPNVDHRGAFWNKLSASAKDGYVNGYSDAMRVSVGQLDSLANAADMFHWRGARKIIRQLSNQLSMSSLSPTDAVRQLDSLYSDSKYSELDLGGALLYLKSREAEASQPPPGAPSK